MVAFAGLSYWHARETDPGLTTETALVATALLGGLAIREPAFAAGVGVVVARAAERPCRHSIASYARC